MTAQVTVKLLESQGFVRSLHGKGTHVVDHPPHLCHYGLWLPVPDTPSLHTGRGRFLHALLEEVERFNANTEGRQIFTYFDNPSDMSHAGYHELLAMVQSHRLAGVIYPYPPMTLRQTELFDTPGVAHVTAGLPRTDQSGLTHVAFRREPFYQRAIERMAEDGRRRLAVLTTETNMNLSTGHLGDLIATWGAPHGMTTQPFWIIPLQATLAPGVRATTRLLFNGPPDERPDALIIDDDHMVEAATLALAAAGIDSTSDVTVVSHCNFPDRPATAVPVVRLGLDCRELLTRMLEAIDLRAAGQSVTPVNWVEPVFEEELSQRDPA
jgi:DNA-binding LacI/PurR family transcriptional regulator